jgi:drug/metabolite transporter (DMT)-like permease
MASILGSAELPVAVLSSCIILQEAVSWVQAAGVAIILLGMTLPRLAQRRQQKSAGRS